jgi:hypothetical protein
MPAVLCIDIEPDDREVDTRSRSRWHGFEQLVPRIAELRDRLSYATGADAHFLWCLRMDRQVAHVWGSANWAAVQYENELRAIAEAGDEIGLHPHSWRWSIDLSGWVNDRTSAWVRDCAEEALTAYRDTFGHRCPAHRFGDRFLSDDLVDILTKAEVSVDLTLEPGFAEAAGVVESEHNIGVLPDTRFAVRVPYRPGPDGFLSPDPGRRDGPLFVPLTDALVIDPRWSAAEGMFKPWGHSDVLSPVREPQHFASMLDRHLAQAAPSHIALAVRTDRVLHERWDHVVTNLEAVCQRGARHGVHWTTGSQAAAIFDAHLVAGRHRSERAPYPPLNGVDRADRWWGGADDRGFIDNEELAAIDALSRDVTDLSSRLQRAQIDAALVASRLADTEEQLADVAAELLAERDRRAFAEMHVRLLQSTKLFRVLAPARRAYGRLRAFLGRSTTR